MSPTDLAELEAAREALSRIYWKSIELGEDRGDSTINHIAANALRGDTSPLHARDRRMKAIGAAEELERLAGEFQLLGFSGGIISNVDVKQRAAQLRQEAEGK